MQLTLAVRQVGVATLACGLLATPGLVSGDDPVKPSPPVILFDGKTLEGWRPVVGARSGKVTEADGSIVLAIGEPMTGVTSTRADLPKTNYALTYEAKRTEGNDFFAAATFPVGSSFVTLINGGWGGSVTGLSLLNGASAAENATSHFVKYQNDVWYSFTIHVTDRVIRSLVDGKEVFAFDHDGIQLKTRIETRPNEPLGFASYRSSGAIRQVQVRSLTPDEIAQVNARVD